MGDLLKPKEPFTQPVVEIGWHYIQGNHAQEMQDSSYISERVAVVCDGARDRPGGREAAQAAVGVFSSHDVAGSVPKSTRQLVEDAQQVTAPGFTTIVAGQIVGDQIEFAWCGDSCVIACHLGIDPKTGQPIPITQEVSTRQINNAGEVTSLLGMSDPDIQSRSLPIRPGWIYLFGSNGITKHSNISAIGAVLGKVLTREMTVQGAAEYLTTNELRFGDKADDASAAIWNVK